MKRQILDIEFWTNKRQIVRNSYEFDENWNEVIERFKSRVEDFYIKPINWIKDPEKLKGEGFSILTIQCALIEMFAAFKLGKIHKYNKKNTDPNYTYKNADDCLIPFLQSESLFENHFFVYKDGVKIVDQPFSASEFYNKVRCGLMHEARTKGEWVINAKRNYIGDETIFISMNTTHNKISIDRTILKMQLQKYFDEYIQNLKQGSIIGNQLRRLFARKLDHLYDFPANTIEFDWWNDN